MPTISTLDGSSMPTGTDAFDPNAQLKTYQDGVSPYHNFRIYDDTTERDADTLPIEGWGCYVISTKSVYRHNGSAWVLNQIVRTAFTPTWTNLTAGNAVEAWYYAVAGGFCDVFGTTTLGSSSSVGTNPYFAFPVTPITLVNAQLLGSAEFEASGTRYHGLVYYESSFPAALPRRFAVSSSQITDSGITSASPFTWATGNRISMRFRYPV